MAKLSIKLPSYGEPRSLEQSVKKELSKFFKKNTRVAEADVRLSHGADPRSEKICGIYLKIEEKNMFTVQKASSFESCIVKAVNKLQNQLNSTYNKID